MRILYIRFPKSKKEYAYLSRNQSHIRVDNWQLPHPVKLWTDTGIQDVEVTKIEYKDYLSAVVTSFVEICPNDLLDSGKIPKEFLEKLERLDKIKLIFDDENEIEKIYDKISLSSFIS